MYCNVSLSKSNDIKVLLLIDIPKYANKLNEEKNKFYKFSKLRPENNYLISILVDDSQLKSEKFPLLKSFRK